VGLGFVWSSLFKMDRATYVPSLCVGLILWQFISNGIVEAASVFNKQSNIIRNLSLPLSLYPAQLLLRHCINLAHNIPLFFVVALVLGTPLTSSVFLALPTFLLVAANIYWMMMLIGILGARFRDLEYFIPMIMPLLMFFTPVMYRPDALPSFMARFMWLNPFADMIEIIRYPLLGQVIPLHILAINAGMLLVGSLITLAFFNAKRNRIAFWV
ncbi:MAG: ABC transporter permease, partial [Alphaproteobacteria bacterium]|nr:ABC transporter permease [Alphaproteobacteria bacterium]